VYEVAPEADVRCTAGWTLYRALRPDVDFLFVGVAEDDSLAAPAGHAHAGVYDVVREDATPDVEGGVVLIDPFEVPEEDDERFLAGWDRAREVLRRQRGYLGARLHRSVGPAGFRFVDVARWSSPLMFARALKQPDFQQAALPFPSHPAVYQPIRGST
jgi:heme-degrading monooxygenase HmoA